VPGGLRGSRAELGGEGPSLSRQQPLVDDPPGRLVESHGVAAHGEQR
jgi:hypothetical protein